VDTLFAKRNVVTLYMFVACDRNLSIFATLFERRWQLHIRIQKKQLSLPKEFQCPLRQK